MKKLKKKTRTTLRITAIKGLNMVEPEKYAALIIQSDATFVEVKSYMNVGSSRERLSYDNMPLHEEIRAFANQICKYCGYKIIDEQKESRVVLMMKKDRKDRIMKF
jgi:tRNA wybutosine-synthesizing protein 1